jgi:opacity protein-like surface antigen
MRPAMQILCATLLTCSANLAFAPAAMAQYMGESPRDYFPTWYVGLRGSVNMLSASDSGNLPLKDTDGHPGFSGGAAVGINMPRALIEPIAGLSFEGEVMQYWQHVDGDSNFLTASGDRNYEITTYMLNAYYNIPTNTLFTPYVGGGFGMADVQLDPDPNAPTPGNDEDSVAAWQAMVGLRFEENPRALTEWHVGYRYLSLDEPQFDNGYGGKTILDTQVHSLEAGVNFRF